MTFHCHIKAEFCQVSVCTEKIGPTFFRWQLFFLNILLLYYAAGNLKSDIILHFSLPELFSQLFLSPIVSSTCCLLTSQSTLVREWRTFQHVRQRRQCFTSPYYSGGATCRKINIHTKYISSHSRSLAFLILNAWKQFVFDCVT